MVEMIKVILSNMFSKPATRQYPFEKREPFAKSRGHLVANLEDCIYCNLCAKKCPSDCIKVDRQEKTWELEPYACIVCGICAEVCPKKCLSLEGEHRSPVYTKEV